MWYGKGGALEAENKDSEKRGARGMKKSMMLLLLVAAVFLGAVASGAEKPFGVEEFTSVNDIANAIASYFPKVQGEVKAVHDDLLTIAIGNKDGLKPGVIIEIWRPNKEIHHPVTGAVIGYTEDEIGDAEAVTVGDTSSTLRMIKKLHDPKPGDTARISPKKISIALIPMRAERRDIIQELSMRLTELGRFSVIENDKIMVFLRDKKQRDAALIKELGRTFGIDVVTAVEIYPSEGGKLLVTTRMFYANEARPLGTIVAMLDLKAKKESFAEVRPFFAPDREESGFFAEGRSFTSERKVTAQLPFDAQLFAIADLEGNGMLHYVFSDGTNIHIYQQEATGWREEWSETESFAIGKMQHINIDVADINGNGKPEIFVTAMRNGKVISYVMEYQDGSYHRIAAMPGFLRVVKYPAKGNILLGQGYDPNSFYIGKPRQYSWSEGKYVGGQEFPLPRGVNLYGFVVADLGETQPFLVAFNSSDQLVVYSNNNAIWKSEERYPAVGISVTKPLTGLDSWQEEAQEHAEQTGGIDVILHRDKEKIKGRVIALDIKGDGKDEILVPKNGVIPYLNYVNVNTVTGLKDAEFVGLTWTGSRLEQQLSIKHIPGMIMDFQAVKQQGTDAQIFALVNIPGWWIKKDTIQVMSYTVK